MPPKKHRKQHRQQVIEQSDYDSEAYAAEQHGAHIHAHNIAAPPVRTNEELNLTVLRRHNPDIQQILSVAPFAVIYYFSAETQGWEKSGVEGTLFICQLTPEVSGYDAAGQAAGVIERFGVTVLNRKGLSNFSTELKSAGDVEITEQYVILQAENEAAGAEAVQGQVGIYGLWIFSEAASSTEHAREISAQVIMGCASRSEQSRVAAEAAFGDETNGYEGDGEDEAVDAGTRNGHHDSYEHGNAGVPTQQDMQPQSGQRIDLLSLFGNQPAPDAQNGNGIHSSYQDQGFHQFQQHQPPPQSSLPHGHPAAAVPQITQAQNLLNLFKR